MAGSSHLLVSLRLRLRPVSGWDIASLHQHWTAPAVRRYLWDDETISRQQVENIVAESERLFVEQGYGLWAICQPDADDLLGCGGYWEFHEPPQLELILSLSPRYWHQGFATEAANLLIDHAFVELEFDEVLASMDVPNTASLQLIDRLGFEYSRRTRAGGLETVFYALSNTKRDPAA